MDQFELPAVTPCGHWFCRECILGVLAAQPRCPLCRRDIGVHQVRRRGGGRTRCWGFGALGSPARSLHAGAATAAPARPPHPTRAPSARAPTPQLRQGVTAAEAEEEEERKRRGAAAAAGGVKAEDGEGACGACGGEGGEGGGAAAPGDGAQVSESKLQALLKELRAMRRADPTAKALM